MNDSVVEINPRKSLAAKAVEDAIRSTENTISYYTVRKEVFDPLVLEMESEIETMTISLCGSSVDISVVGKKAVLNTAVGILRKYGFTAEHRPKEGDPTYGSYFCHTTGATVFFHFSSSQCKRVQTGTKMVEQAIYETICDE